VTSTDWAISAIQDLLAHADTLLCFLNTHLSPTVDVGLHNYFLGCSKADPIDLAVVSEPGEVLSLAPRMAGNGVVIVLSTRQVIVGSAANQ
jgi:hypothetical protein